MMRVKLVGRGLEDWIGCSEIGFGCLRRGDETDPDPEALPKALEKERQGGPLRGGLWGRVGGMGCRCGLAFRGAGVRLVRLEIPVVSVDQVRVALDDQQVLRVFRLGLMGEVEAAGDERGAVDEHDLVVGDGVVGVDERGQALFEEELQVRW